MKNDPQPSQYDVAILGGGLAGLTLALQLKRTRPAMRIFIAEKQKHPVPEAAHKVGESTVEIGGAILPLLDSYQLDRGRIENMLSEYLPDLGVKLLDGAKVQRIDLRPEGERHRIQILQEGSEQEIEARWVVDASGRSSLLKRQLGLARKVEHAANAVWFRINHEIDIDQW